MNRRQALAKLGSLTCLIATGLQSRSFGGSAGTEVANLVKRIDEISAAVRGGTISIADWRSGMDDLLGRVALEDLLDAIDFPALAKSTGYAKLGVATARIDFGAGDVRPLRFLPKLFAVDKGRSIIPHGHANMISAHLPLSGDFRLRQYDQIARDDTSLTIRPSIDRTIRPGDLSSISEADDNVHWFIAEEPAHTFDVIVTELQRDADHPYEIFNLDIESAVRLGDGTYQVPRLSVDDALRKYG